MDQGRTEAQLTRPRPCPWCSTRFVTVFMRPVLEPAPSERERISGPRRSFQCRICGLGEVVDISPDGGDGAGEA